ncbi:MAG: hypothetical protein M1839_004995, partial [Geoglossum umbratile]
MAARTLLGDKGVKIAKEFLSSVVPHPQALIQELERTRNLSIAIDRAGLPHAPSSKSRRKLQFLIALDDAAQGNLELMSRFWGEESIRDVALKYAIPNGPESSLEWTFQTRLFILEPTAILYRLVLEDVIAVEPSDIKLMVANVFRFAISRDFNISREPVRIILDDAEIQDSVSDSVKRFFWNIQRLQALVPHPQAIRYLIGSRYTSAHIIAHTPRSSFVASMAHAGLPEESAVSIHSHAITVESRNEHAWATMLGSQNNAPLAWMAADMTRGSQRAHIDYTTLFGDIHSGCCDDCASVTGPAAYFVDLLRMLKFTHIDPTNKQSPSLLDRLLAKRPDLQNLELSCPNTDVMIPYIDLVNEIMESFIRKTLADSDTPGAVKIGAFNMDDQDTSEDCIMQSHTTDFDVYRRIQSQVFPLGTFPYNQAIDTLRTFLTSLGSSRYELLFLFQSKYRLDNGDVNLRGEAQVAINNALAAEYLSLQLEDFIPITYTSFFQPEYCRKWEKSADVDYNSEIGLLTTGEYWGFPNDPENPPNVVMVSYNENNKGLPFIQDQLLPRAAISFQDLLDILGTRFVRRRLALENDTGSNEFTGKLEELRLLHPTRDRPKAQLNGGDCRSLQAFIRLWRKTGWPLAKIDSAIACSTGCGEDSLPLIGPKDIRFLAAAQKVESSTGMDMDRLLPLWGDIDTYGNKSLYSRIYLRGKPNGGDSVFEKDENGQYLQAQTTFSQHLSVLLSSLRLSQENFEALLPTAKLTVDSLMSLSNVSSLYRNFLLCGLLGIPPLQYGNFISIHGKSFSPFDDPEATLNTIGNWKALVDFGFSLPQLLYIVGMDGGDDEDDQTYGPSAGAILKVATTIVEGVVKVRKTYPNYPNGEAGLARATAGEVTRLSSILFDPATATEVVLFVEDPLHYPSGIDFFSEVLAQYFGDDPSRTRTVFFNPNDANNTPTALQDRLAQRRLFYLQGVLPFVRSRLIHEVVLDATRALFPHLDPAVLQALLSDIINIERELPISGLEALSRLPLLDDSQEHMNDFLDAYFMPPSTDEYRFYTSDSSLYIDGASVPKTKPMRLANGQSYRLVYRRKRGGHPRPLSFSTTRAPRCSFTQDMIILLEAVSTAGQVLRQTARAAEVILTFKLVLREIQYLGRLASGSPLAVDFNRLTLDHIQRIRRYCALRDSFPLSSALSLLDFFQWVALASRSSSLASQLSLLTGWPEDQIQSILDAKYSTLPNADRARLFQDDDAELTSLKNIIRFVNRVDLQGATLPSLFEWATPQVANAADRDFANAAQLRDLVRSITSSASGGSIVTKANNRLRMNQRKALISYLLQQGYIRERRLRDADDLFEFFLIDVQMGSCLKTSRIKQAISTVQLFAQRCALGLEDGILPSAIDQERWNWMQKYRLWEANRKIFLYPENWLDPTLRDDKTEIFKAMESSILQNNINPATLVDQIKSYIYAADGIADLDTQMYKLVENGGSQGCGQLHFFARTRTAPYHQYYRKLDIVGVNPSPNVIVFWQPWAKMDVDMPMHEVDPDGKMLPISGSYLKPAVFGDRLFLFLPHVTLKSTPQSDASTKKPQDMASQAVGSNVAGRYWQIQMGWSEYRNGRWTPKQMSQGTVDVVALQASDFSNPSSASSWEGWEDGQRFPDISSFRFWVKTTKNVDPNAPDILAITVDRCVRGDGQVEVAIPLGSFEMRGTQLVQGGPKPLIHTFSGTDYRDRTVPTVFSKLPWHVESDSQTLSVTLGNYESYWLCGPRRREVWLTPPIAPREQGAPQKRDIRWTVSFEGSSATFYVQDVANAGNTTSYFVYPDVSTNQTTHQVDRFQHVLSPTLVNAATMYDSVDQVYKLLAATPENYQFSAFGKRNGPFHELSTPYAIYNWELGLHVIMLLMERLLATQQFDLAIKVARYVFDPTADGTGLERCWLFPPFRATAIKGTKSIEDILDDLKPDPDRGSAMSPVLTEWMRNPFNPHAVARGRPEAYMKRVVMKYIETLVANGDKYFRQNTLEAIPLAIQFYVEASHVCGLAPSPMPRLGKRTYKTYFELENLLDDFSNARVDLELEFPFYSDPASRGGNGNDSCTTGLIGFIKTTYFCIPLNPRLIDLRNLINDRLYKIRHCQDINGVAQQLALFEPPIDPGLLARAATSGQNLSILLNDLIGPMPNYRFVYLLQKAFELCAELKGMGAKFLSVKENKDAQSLSALRARQDNVLQTLSMDVKQMLKREVEKSIEALQEVRKGQVSRLSYYLALSGDQSKQIPGGGEEWEDILQSIEQPTKDDLRMTSNEKLEMDKAEEAAESSSKAMILETLSGVFRAIPAITMNAQPLGIGASMAALTVNVAEALLAAASVMRMKSQQSNDQGLRASRKAQLIKQLQERRMLANMAGNDIKCTDKQIATLNSRLGMCENDIKLQQRQIAHAAEIEEWLENRYTSEQLYAWMDGSVRNLFYQTFLLADDLAKKAQKAFHFEQGSNASEFIEQGYWDTGRDGLLSAENLYLGLKRMEASYLDNRNHDFEISKNVSLRQIRPWALLSLRENGLAEFSLPEVLFDVDFPGHYYRRIKSVSLSVPCVVGPYTSINATLTLLNHKYRISTTGAKYEESATDGGDSRFRTDHIPITSIAVSHGLQDSGTFSLDFHDERYVPFEGAGAISTWRIELPPTTVQQFDYNTISDVILHMRYTGLNGGMSLRNAALTAVQRFQDSVKDVDVTDGLFAMFDLKNDYATEWCRFMLRATGDGDDVSMTLAGLQDRLPFWTKTRKAYANNVWLVIASTELPGDLKLENTPGEVMLGRGGEDIAGCVVAEKALTNADPECVIGDWELKMTKPTVGIERMILLVSQWDFGDLLRKKQQKQQKQQ